MTPMADLWLARPRPDPRARLRLVCFPHAGVGPAVFHAWPGRFPPDVEVCAVRLPGRESRLREAPFTRLATLVAALADGLKGALGTSFAFFGHSLGALVAFELTRELRRRRAATPRHLFVAARRAPHRPERYPSIAHVSDPEFVTEICARYNGIPNEILRHPDLVALVLPTLRADFALLEGYVHAEEEPLDCPITVLAGTQDASVTDEDLAAWRRHTRDAFRVRRFPGDHFFVQSARDLVARAVADELPAASEAP